jgi:stage II sporulation protein D
MPRDWPLDAVKAQAVAARSYALAHRRGGGFDVYNDTRDQVYGGIAAQTPTGDQAVLGTKNKVLLYGGKPATTFFYSSSGGRTANVTDVFASAKPIPYLVSVPDPYDTFSPYHTWGPVPIAATTVASALAIPGVTGLKAVGKAHARAFLVTGRNGDVPVASGDVRRALGLRSTWWSKIGVLSLSRPAGNVPPGTAVTLTGRAVQVAAPVLEQREGTGAWQAAPALTVQPDGTFTVVVMPQTTTQYRLSSGTIKSAVLRVAVVET